MMYLHSALPATVWVVMLEESTGWTPLAVGTTEAAATAWIAADQAELEADGLGDMVPSRIIVEMPTCSTSSVQDAPAPRLAHVVYQQGHLSHSVVATDEAAAARWIERQGYTEDQVAQVAVPTYTA